jgi:hypothetical protein
MDWGELRNAFIQTGAVAAGAAFTSFQTQPVAPWQVHAAAAGVAALSYLMGKLQQSPINKPVPLAPELPAASKS